MHAAGSHIGRIGALAVALGVGFAIASGTAVANADESSESSSAGDTSSDAASSSASPSTPVSSDTAPATPDDTAQPTVPEMDVSSSDGAVTSTSNEADAPVVEPKKTATTTVRRKDPANTTAAKEEQPRSDKTYTVGKDTTLTVPVANGVKAGTRYEKWQTGIEVKTSFGTLTMNTDGSFTYTPNKGFVGTDTFVYFFHTSEVGDGPFTATIAVTGDESPSEEPNYGTSLALDSAMGACWNEWMPWQHGPGGENLTCLYPEASMQNSLPSGSASTTQVSSP